MTAPVSTAARSQPRALPRALPQGLPRAHVLLGWLLVAHVVLKLLIYPLVMETPPFGDESAYVNGGMALSNLVRDVLALTEPDLAEVQRNVVASGWFMPGMSIVIAPLYLVFPEAPAWLLRGYLGVVTLLLLVAVVRTVARRIGPGWACVILLPGLVPSWVVFTYAAYGDLCAGLVLILLLVHLVSMFRGLRRGEAPSLKEGVVLGVIAIAVLYLRSSTSILLAGLGVVTLLTALLMLRGRTRWRAVGSAVLAGVVFLLLLAPWSLFASHTLEGRVLTTTTVPTVMANTFGDRSQLCFGECDPDSTIWFRPVRYSREVARATDTSEVDVLKVMSDHALRDLQAGDYLDQVVHNLGAYALQPNNFTGYLAPEDGRGPVGRVGQTVAEGVTWALYAPMILLGAISLLVPVRRSLEARVLDVLVKLSLGALLVQPFVHVSGARYWTTAGLVFAIAAASFLRERQIGLGLAPAPPSGVVTAADATAVRWLGRVQAVLASLTAVVVVVLLGAVLL